VIKHDSEKRRFDLNEINHDNEETKFCDFILGTQIVHVTTGHKKCICFFSHFSGHSSSNSRRQANSLS
jgi:hypothetical protein